MSYLQSRHFCRLTPLVVLHLVVAFFSYSAVTIQAAPPAVNATASSVATKGARARSTRALRRFGVLGQSTPLTRSTIRRPAASQQKVAARIVRRGAPLQFKFDGFSAEQATNFQNFINVAYPLMVQLYGEPAPAQQGKTLRVAFSATAGDGLYELPPANSTTEAGRILYEPVLPGAGLSVEQARNVNNYNVARQILIAFHGRSIFSFDAWELGFSDAAALIIMYQALGRPANFDASSFGVYLLPVYDFFNRPELGNAYFFTSNETVSSSPILGFFRAGMAQAAWLKVWVENPNFFRSFNTAYYAQDAASPAPLSAPALKQIAAGIVPNVEGLRFTDWYRRQHVLDTSVTTGDKLWAAVLPLAQNATDASSGTSLFFGLAQYYRTLPNGDEQALNGVGTLSAFDETGVNITDRTPDLSNSNNITFRDGETEVAVGFKNLGAPNQARITLVFRINGAESVAYFPYNVAGTETQPSGFYGATLGTNNGQVRVQVQGGASAAATLARSAFKASLTYPTGPRVRTSFNVLPSDGAAPRVLWRNSAWSYFNGRPQSLAVLLETAPANTAVPVTWPIGGTTPGANRLRMISLPLFPLESDEADVLGIDPRNLLLARYRPNLSPASFSAAGIQFGISTDRHEIYPNISQPIIPGRGYWLKLQSDLSTTVRGGEPPRNAPYEVPLLGGWNQIGVPFRIPFNLNEVRVSLNNAPSVVFSVAVGRGWVSPGVWRWKAEGGYARVDTGTTAGQVLQPFEGYYVFTTQPRGVKLVFEASAATANNAARSTPVALAPATVPGEWTVALSATSTTARDTDNAFGTTTIVNGKPRRLAAAKPPAGERALTLTFLSGGTAPADATRAGDASGWADSFVPVFSSGATWQFLVDGAAAGQNVRLNWGDLKSVPANLSLTLADETSGQRIVLSDANPEWGYVFTAGTTARRFRIEARAVTPGIMNLRVDPWMYSMYAMVSADLASAGQVTVEILDSNGQQVRLLAGSVPARAGRNTWLWNGRDAWGRPVRGTFTARVVLIDARGVRHQQDRSFTF